jgi:hypothetical protein
MGRHAEPSAARRRLPQLTPPVLIGAAVLVVLLVGGLVWWGTSASSGPEGPCDNPQDVRVVVAPELSGLARDLLAEPVPVDEEVCAVASVRAQEPLETVANLRALDESVLPHVWVPDSSLWTPRAEGAELNSAGQLTSSPIVLATNQTAVDELGWAEEPPSWAEVLGEGRPLAVPDLAVNIEALLAMGAVHASLGGGEEADNAVVQVALTAARGTIPSPAEAIAAAVEGGADAPLGALSEQEVLATNREAGTTGLVAIYPSDGSPVLDYPVLHVGEPGSTMRSAVAAVTDVLTSDGAREAARQLGFRGVEGEAPAGELLGVQEEAPEELALDATTVQTLLSRLASLATPSRLLTVIDVSTSMNAAVGNGTRATLARDAAKSALALLPETASAGLWVFARELEGANDWTELVPLRTLGANADGLPQRQVLATQLDTLPDRLTPGGTGLYDTTLAAVRAAREAYDADFVNSVVIITDGENEDDGIALEALLESLRAEADPERPIKVFGIALGADADLSALEQIAEVTGGGAYSAEDPNDLQSVLFSALGERSG